MVQTLAPTSSKRRPAVRLKQQASSGLKRLILPGGSVQSVRQLAVQLEMSKTPIQAAIGRLDAEGFLTLAPQQGVVIRELSMEASSTATSCGRKFLPISWA